MVGFTLSSQISPSPPLLGRKSPPNCQTFHQSTSLGSFHGQKRMETELQRLVNISTEIEHSVSTRDPNGDGPKYTSLRDIIPQLPATKGVPNFYQNFNSVNISIRNQLVKQAASAYLQSAAILTSRNQNWLASLWQKATSPAAWRSAWQKYVRDPATAFFTYIIKPICRTLAHMANGICL